MGWNFSIISNSFMPLLLALSITIWISLASIGLGTFLGIALGITSLTTHRWIAWPAQAFIELFLALPTLVILVWLYYSLPAIVPGFILDGQLCAILGLGLSLSAFVADIIRSGINAVSPGEMEVAYCTGLSKIQAVRYILMPQVIQRSWLPLMGQYITTYKFSTLASVIAVPEILHTANAIIAQTYRPLEIYSIVAFLFTVTIIPLNLFLRRFQKVQELGGIERI
jgi:polar amino acid transport system permease protein